MQVLTCQIGEIFDKNLIVCTKCPAGKYSFDLKSDSCESCPTEAKLCSGSNVILQAGYWKSDFFSTNIYTCEPISESCLEGNKTQCDVGYVGPLCQSCSISGVVYRKFFDQTCRLCYDKTLFIIFEMISASFVMALFYAYLMHSNLKLSDTIKFDEFSGKITEFSKEEYMETIYNKILMNYFQVMSLVKGLNFKWDYSISVYIGITSYFGDTFNYVFNFDCLIDDTFPVEAIYLRVIFVCLSPFFTIIMIFVFWTVKTKSHQMNISKRKMVFWDHYIICELTMMGILQPIILKVVTQIASCRNINGVQLILNNYEIECSGEKNFIILFCIAIPSLLLWNIFYPLVYLFKLRRQKEELNSAEVRKRLGVFYNCYKLKYYYWEIFEISKKYILIVVINFTQIANEQKGLIVLCALYLFIQMIVYKQPYINKDSNKLALISEVTNTITIILGLLSVSINEDYFTVFSTYLIYLANTYFLFNVYGRLLLIYANKMKFFINKFPFLIRYFGKMMNTKNLMQRAFTRTFMPKRKVLRSKELREDLSYQTSLQKVVISSLRS